MNSDDRERLIKYQEKYENKNQDHNLMCETGIKWIEILENEFDRRLLDLDAFINRLNERNDEDKNDSISNAKRSLSEISSIFAQLTHKALVVFDQNNKLENDLDHCKKDLKMARSECKLLNQKLDQNQQKKQNDLINYHSLTRSTNRSINSTRLSNRVMSLSNVSRSNSNLFNMKCNYLNQSNDSNFSEIYAEQEIAALRDDNLALKKLNISLKSELFGTRLAIKYLNKELSGRIQQIQLLSKFFFKSTMI